MRITANAKLIHRRARLGKFASMGGIAVLVGGMLASFRPQLVTLSLLALVLGFVLAQFGAYNLRRWGRSPRPDEVLAAALKGLDDRYHFYAWVLRAPAVLLTPHGVYSFLARDQSGQIGVRGRTWRSKFSLSRALLFLSQEGLGNPTDEAQAQAQRLGDWIRRELPEIEIAVQPVIVFIDPHVQLDVVDPAAPVLAARDVKKWLRGAGKGNGLKTAEHRALEMLFDGALR